MWLLCHASNIIYTSYWNEIFIGPQKTLGAVNYYVSLTKHKEKWASWRGSKCCAEVTMTMPVCIAGMNDESRNHLILIVFTYHYYEVKSPGVWWSPSLQRPGRRALGNPLRWPPRKWADQRWSHLSREHWSLWHFISPHNTSSWRICVIWWPTQQQHFTTCLVLLMFGYWWYPPWYPPWPSGPALLSLSSLHLYSLLPTWKFISGPHDLIMVMTDGQMNRANTCWHGAHTGW